MKTRLCALLGSLFLAAQAAQAQFSYTTNADGVSITILGFTGPPGSLTIPTNFNGLTVTDLGDNAFAGRRLTSVTIPGSVTNIGEYAFSNNRLTGAYFQGNAPSADATVFADGHDMTVYYLLGSTGWGTTFGGYPTALWSSGLVTNGGFETGDFTGWTLVGTTIYDDTIDNAVVSYGVTAGGVNYVHSGIYGAELSGNYGPDAAEFGPLTRISQSLPTISGQRYVLSFWLENASSEAPVIFNVNWTTDGSSTNNIYALTNPPVFAWTNLSFMVTAESTNTTLEFAAENFLYYFGLDEISVVALSHPAIAGIALSGTNLVINGSNGFSGIPYHVLTGTNLALPLSQWIPVATNVLSASGNFTITVTNTVTPNVPERFYILETL